MALVFIDRKDFRVNPITDRAFMSKIGNDGELAVKLVWKALNRLTPPELYLSWDGYSFGVKVLYQDTPTDLVFLYQTRERRLTLSLNRQVVKLKDTIYNPRYPFTSAVKYLYQEKVLLFRNEDIIAANLSQ